MAAAHRKIKTKNRANKLKKLKNEIGFKLKLLKRIDVDLSKDHVDDKPLAKSLLSSSAKARKHLTAAVEALA